MKILITFALETEFAPWRSLRPFAKISSDSIAGYEARFGGTEVRVLLTGVGRVNAKRAARHGLEWNPDLCISSGLAGSLRADCRIGQVCAACEVVELETGRSVAADAELLRRAEAQGARMMAKLLTSTEMILSSSAKNRLANMAEAVEMESFAVINETSAAGVPSIAIRAISDAADEDLPMNFGGLLDEDGNVVPSKVAKAVARAPQKLPALIRLAKNSRAASRKLAGFLQVYVAAIAAVPEHSAELEGARRA